jgi:lipopolysaccharide transport system ATP-binding protein
MFARLAFAVNAFVEPDILIIDEALSVGDAFFQSKCMDKMRTMIESGVTILFVSHDTFAVKNLCQRAFLIDAGQIVMDASANEVVETYRDEILKMRHELTGGETGAGKNIIGELRAASDKFAKGKINLPVNFESIKINQENFKNQAAYQRLQNGRANFENVQLLNLDGEPIFEVIFGQKVILRMFIKFNEDIAALGIGYHIRNTNGVDLVYNDTRFSDIKSIFDAKRGEIYVVDWSFKVELRQELYNFACSISTPVEETMDSPDLCDFVPCALQFKVVSPNKFLSLPGGYVHWHNDMQITKLGNKG